jgi:hypothetical protein
MRECGNAGMRECGNAGMEPRAREEPPARAGHTLCKLTKFGCLSLTKFGH